MTSMMLTVDVTPDGHGDCIRQIDGRDMFVLPEERRMSLHDFSCHLRSHDSANADANADDASQTVFSNSPDPPSSVHSLSMAMSTSTATSPSTTSMATVTPVVYYYSRQNDCLRTELSPLFHKLSIPPTVPILSEAFESDKPQAINLWVGNESAKSAMHKDYYENLYYVCSGEKTFVLCPPSDALLLEEAALPTGRFACIHGQWTVHPVLEDTSAVAVAVASSSSMEGEEESLSCREQYTHWIKPNVQHLLPQRDETHTSPSFLLRKRNFLKQYPLLQHVKPIRVTVRAGQMLYLPALWFHQVSQSCETVAINYWYDMRFDSPLYCYFHLVQSMKVRSKMENGSAERDDGGGDDDDDDDGTNR